MFDREVKHMENPSEDAQQTMFFSEQEKQGLYRTIFTRRDVRGQFKPDPVSNEILSRVLTAAHHAPSVGFMQPWNFIVIKEEKIKRKIYEAFKIANEEAAGMFEGDKRETYQKLKLEGIQEAPVNICVTCDRSRSGPAVIGRTHIKIMDLYSSVCAVQNLWLAARAEGLGVGWVSILRQKALQDALNIPRNIIPVAYLCVGYVTHFFREPELQTAGWLPRLPLEELIYFENWKQKEDPEQSSLLEHIRRDKDRAKAR